MELTNDGNMASARVGKLWLAATGAHPIKDETWRQYLGHAATSVKSDGPFHGLLLWTPRHGPAAAQRKMLTEEFAAAVALDEQRCVALVSDSPLVRGTITAINWFTRSNVVAFSPRSVQSALDWLAEIVAFDRGQAQRALDQIIAGVGGQLRKSGAS